jgi:hypothetical protein
LAYLRSDIPGHQRTDLKFKHAESIPVEVHFSNYKWIIYEAYRPPSLQDSCFEDDVINTLDRATNLYNNIMVIGDLNSDLLHSDKAKPVSNICDIFDFVNIVKGATCYTKRAPPSLIDVILTNKPRLCYNMCNFNCGVSDVHNIISTQFKCHVDPAKNKTLPYRSFLAFGRDMFVADLECAPFNVAHVFDDINDVYWAHEEMLLQIVNSHAPVKTRKTRKSSAPFMNRALRKAIFKKREL